VSSALAIASVTSILKDLLDSRLIDHAVTSRVGDVTVTALPPDRIPVGADERGQLNLFLYRMTPHSGWRIVDPSSSAGSPPPLALNLHYLLTAYGEQDFQAEILLGYAMQLLHETPLLPSETIREVLASISRNGATGRGDTVHSAVSVFDLADHVEQLSVRPEFLSTDETSKLWSALQARYRPSAAYEVSTVSIEAHR
jgi:Pvc16 N-terminal domain